VSGEKLHGISQTEMHVFLSAVVVIQISKHADWFLWMQAFVAAGKINTVSISRRFM